MLPEVVSTGSISRGTCSVQKRRGVCAVYTPPPWDVPKQRHCCDIIELVEVRWHIILRRYAVTCLRTYDTYMYIQPSIYTRAVCTQTKPGSIHKIHQNQHAVTLLYNCCGTGSCQPLPARKTLTLNIQQHFGSCIQVSRRNCNDENSTKSTGTGM